VGIEGEQPPGGAGGGDPCDVGAEFNGATPGNLDLFGVPFYFNEGNQVPAGTYEFTYVDGCMKYQDGQPWTVNAYASGTYATWQVIGEDPDTFLGSLPGKSELIGGGAPEDFETCVAASKLATPLVIVIAAPSKLGVRLNDSPVTDNIAGIDGRNPKWGLRKLDCGAGGAGGSQ
jgi:hypothetical protein